MQVACVSQQKNGHSEATSLQQSLPNGKGRTDRVEARNPLHGTVSLQTALTSGQSFPLFEDISPRCRVKILGTEHRIKVGYFKYRGKNVFVL